MTSISGKTEHAAASTNSLKFTVSLLKLAYRAAGTAMWENADAIIVLDKSLSGTEYCKVLQRLPYQPPPMNIHNDHRKPNNTLSQLPGPKMLPILGNLLQIDLKKLHSILEEWGAVYGGHLSIQIVQQGGHSD